MVLIFFSFVCHQTIRVAVFLEFETISSCWTWYGTGFLYFNLTEQREPPRYQILKQYKFAGLGILLTFFLFCHPTIRVTALLDFKTISSCWTWYGTGFFCLFNLTEQ